MPKSEITSLPFTSARRLLWNHKAKSQRVVALNGECRPKRDCTHTGNLKLDHQSLGARADCLCTYRLQVSYDNACLLVQLL